MLCNMNFILAIFSLAALMLSPILYSYFWTGFIIAKRYKSIAEIQAWIFYSNRLYCQLELLKFQTKLMWYLYHKVWIMAWIQVDPLYDEQFINYMYSIFKWLWRNSLIGMVCINPPCLLLLDFRINKFIIFTQKICHALCFFLFLACLLLYLCLISDNDNRP